MPYDRKSVPEPPFFTQISNWSQKLAALARLLELLVLSFVGVGSRNSCTPERTWLGLDMVTIPFYL